jgi:hypothetical protein
MASGLFNNFFQLGYVTSNLAKALENYRRRFGPVEFQVMDTPPEYVSPIRRGSFAWMGSLMIEVNEIDTSRPSIYAASVPQADGAIGLHHTGYLVDDHEATLRKIKQEGYEIPVADSMKDGSGTILDFCYADTRKDLGHYCEFIRLDKGGRDWFSSVPGFQAFPKGQI